MKITNFDTNIYVPQVSEKSEQVVKQPSDTVIVQKPLNSNDTVKEVVKCS